MPFALNSLGTTRFSLTPASAWASDGTDVLIGGPGQDRLDGGVGEDRLDGGPERDELDGGLDTDQILGGGGDDVIIVVAGDVGARRTEVIEGGAGADTLLLDGFTGRHLRGVDSGFVAAVAH